MPQTTEFEVVNPTGYIAGGDLDFKKRPRPRPRREMEKSLCVAYLAWLFGGWLGLHHFYLRRDRQAFTWFCTLGGYFGVGWMRDFFRLPSYVKDANNEEKYTANLAELMLRRPKPPFSAARFTGQILVANSWSYLIAAAVPVEEIHGYSILLLLYLAPIGTALAVWNIGNIGREQGSLKSAMVGAFLVFPASLFYPPLANWSAVSSTLVFNQWGKKWRRTPYPRHSLCRRLMVLGLCTTIFLSLWFSFLYFNATVTDKTGERIKLRDAAENFLNSPMFLEFKKNMKQLYNDIMEDGWQNAWSNFVELLDPLGERHSLKILGLESGASQENITSAYRKLAREWHPDRHPPDTKESASAKFMEIQEAYDKLSTIKNRRLRKNKLSDDDAI
ncbi:dnaJ homolog subfamily C member 22 isoform X1 [Palaemon carinicauda]|uniref:dnaJ homolog subfamily C member 22 isoform X1 n=1 Tax=Palaemon carinicauda TaxID=392227 RepID=UPI0035B63677